MLGDCVPHRPNANTLTTGLAVISCVFYSPLAYDNVLTFCTSQSLIAKMHVDCFFHETCDFIALV
jgi:hypothetical protein